MKILFDKKTRTSLGYRKLSLLSGCNHLGCVWYKKIFRNDEYLEKIGSFLIKGVDRAGEIQWSLWMTPAQLWEFITTGETTI